ncbi:MAG: DNA-binding domain-containing protein [Azospirillaceae bacterium]|nr:DNA-binding domain-containing protein [Azospirillaceae bacterium]
MPTPLERQRALRDWILGGDGTPPLPNAGLHHDNTLGGLAAALALSFPVVSRLVGEDCFAGLARAFIRRHPPCEAPLLRYGREFPAFLAARPVAALPPYLSDIARLEAAWNHAFHAPEADALEPAALAALGEEAERAILRLHPSHRFVVSDWPVDLIWQNNLDIPGRDAVRLLLVRPNAEVLMKRLSPGALAFLMGVAAGQPLGTAWDGALALEADFDLRHELTGLLAMRAFFGVHLP